MKYASTLCYVCGKYSSADRAGVEANIAAAVEVGLGVARCGATPVIPHSNTGDQRFEQAQSYEFWIEGTLALMRACHAIIAVPGWETSRGAQGEIAEAKRLGIPVFYWLEELKAWLETRA